MSTKNKEQEKHLPHLDGALSQIKTGSVSDAMFYGTEPEQNLAVAGDTIRRSPPPLETPSKKSLIEDLVSALKRDADYRLGWQANLAMATYDAMASLDLPHATAHKISNEAADRFLHVLLSDSKPAPEPRSQMRCSSWSDPLDLGGPVVPPHLGARLVDHDPKKE